MMQFRKPVVQPDIDINIKQLPLAKQDKTLVSKVMVYGLHGNNKMVDKIILYTGEKVLEQKEQSVLGILCLTGGCSVITLPMQCTVILKAMKMTIFCPFFGKKL